MYCAATLLLEDITRRPPAEKHTPLVIYLHLGGTHWSNLPAKFTRGTCDTSFSHRGCKGIIFIPAHQVLFCNLDLQIGTLLYLTWDHGKAVIFSCSVIIRGTQRKCFALWFIFFRIFSQNWAFLNEELKTNPNWKKTSRKKSPWTFFSHFPWQHWIASNRTVVTSSIKMQHLPYYYAAAAAAESMKHCGPTGGFLGPSPSSLFTIDSILAPRPPPGLLQPRPAHPYFPFHPSLQHPHPQHFLGMLANFSFFEKSIQDGLEMCEIYVYLGGGSLIQPLFISSSNQKVYTSLVYFDFWSAHKCPISGVISY